MAEFDDVNVNGELRVRGLPAVRLIGGCFFVAQGGPGFFAQIGFEPTIITNGPGDYTLTLLTNPGPIIAVGALYIGLDGLPGTVSVLPMIGAARVQMFHLCPPAGDGLPVDGACTLLIASLT